MEFHIPVQDRRTKTTSLTASISGEKASNLAVSLWQDDNAELSGAMVAFSEPPAYELVVFKEPCELRCERTERTPLYEALLTAE